MQTEALEGRVMLSAAAVGSVDTQAVDLGGNLPTFSEFDVGEASMATVDTLTDGDPIRGEKDQPVSKGESTDGDPIRGEKDQPVSKGESTDGDPIRGEKDQPVSGEQTNLKSADDVGFNPQPQPPGNDWVIAGNPSLQEQPGADVGFNPQPQPPGHGWIIAGNPSLQEQPGSDVGFNPQPQPPGNDWDHKGITGEATDEFTQCHLDSSEHSNHELIDGKPSLQEQPGADVGFNPQPQPPGNDWIIAGNPSLQEQPGSDVGFNPQPQPPGNDWVIVGNPSLQEQPGADGIWHSGDGWPVTALSTQIDTDSGDNMNQLGDIKGKDSLIRDLDYPEESIAG
jgi:hypothetical protein